MASQPYLQGLGRGRGRGSRQRMDEDTTGQKNHERVTANPQQKKAMQRFQASVANHQQAVEQHISQVADYSSSDEDEEDNRQDEHQVLSSVMDQYGSLTNNADTFSVSNLGATEDYLTTAMKPKGSSCIICIETVRKNEAIWSCSGCSCIFHITCIQKWIKDGSYQQIKNDDDNSRLQEIPWHCPKCRHSYKQSERPTRYYCFCGKVEDPEFDPWLLPHTCGQRCDKQLKPACGHRCLLLCHPGPCPPCPKTIRTRCYCGKSSEAMRRCADKLWSCDRQCGQLLTCGQHRCQDNCHAGECKPCPKTSIQPCVCGSNSVQRPCAEPTWQCTKVCGAALPCGNHTCEVVCHDGSCGDCPRTGLRTCPCGKSEHQLPCTEEPPTCPDTCGALLPCGAHTCEQRCHYGECTTCRQMSMKRCRCGNRTKQLPCCKEYVCETRCTKWKDCQKHQCKRKCCAGDCLPCETQCNKLLACKNHKCASLCHRGPCYPCREVVSLNCACGATRITVPCGRERVTKPPLCKQMCRKKPDCHHAERDRHRCHFGDCPPCSQTCGKSRDTCQHPCPARCHTAVTVKIKHKSKVKRAGPWEPPPEDKIEIRKKECPPCVVPVPVTCLGLHETVDVACSEAREESCHRPCGQPLACGNHLCQKECHLVADKKNPEKGGERCESCTQPCSNPRPDSCTHICLQPCHPGPCKPCKQGIRMKCHCALMLKHVQCDQWTSAGKTEKINLQSCMGTCPKTLTCGHQCKSTCHPAPCPSADHCKDKVKLRCPCKRRKQDALCYEVKVEGRKLPCDARCEELKRSKSQENDAVHQKKEADLLAEQQQELEAYERKMAGRKRKPRKARIYVEETTFYQRHYKLVLVSVIVVLLGVISFFIINS